VNEPARTLQRRVGERVRELRADRGLTQLRLAERSGISRPSIANVEAGRQNVSLRQLCALASALGVEVGDLVGSGSTPMPG
jgi:transcriptional regulator with XRE-family HTH domain